MIEERFKKLVEYLETGVEAIARTGVKTLECRERYIKLSMPLAGNTNHIGIMYAGTLFTLSEIPGGAIFGVSFDVKKYFPIVKEVSIRFRRPAMTDVTLELGMEKETVEALTREVESKGKADFPLQLEIRDATDEVVATVNGTWQIRALPSGMTSPLAEFV